MKDADKKKHSTKKILLSAGSIFILVLAAVSFIFIPAIVQNTGTDLPPLGYYNKKPIEYKQGTYFASAYQYYSDMVGSGSNQIESEFRILNSAFTDTVIHMAYAEAVKKSGYIVPDTEIDRTMLPYFYDSNGVYSAKIFHDTPDSTKIELREAITDSLLEPLPYRPSDVLRERVRLLLGERREKRQHQLSRLRQSIDILPLESDGDLDIPQVPYRRQEVNRVARETRYRLREYDIDIPLVGLSQEGKKSWTVHLRSGDSLV